MSIGIARIIPLQKSYPKEVALTTNCNVTTSDEMLNTIEQQTPFVLLIHVSETDRIRNHSKYIHSKDNITGNYPSYPHF